MDGMRWIVALVINTVNATVPCVAVLNRTATAGRLVPQTNPAHLLCGPKR